MTNEIEKLKQYFQSMKPEKAYAEWGKVEMAEWNVSGTVINGYLCRNFSGIGYFDMRYIEPPFCGFQGVTNGVEISTRYNENFQRCLATYFDASVLNSVETFNSPVPWKCSCIKCERREPTSSFTRYGGDGARLKVYISDADIECGVIKPTHSLPF